MGEKFYKLEDLINFKDSENAPKEGVITRGFICGSSSDGSFALIPNLGPHEFRVKCQLSKSRARDATISDLKYYSQMYNDPECTTVHEVEVKGKEYCPVSSNGDIRLLSRIKGVSDITPLEPHTKPNYSNK